MSFEEQAGPGTAVVARGARARDYLAMLRRRAWILAACAVLIPVAAYIAIAVQPRRQRAAVIVQPEPLLPRSAIVSDAVPPGWFLAPNGSFVALLAQTPQVRVTAAHIVRTPPTALGDISVTPNQKTGWVTIEVTAATARSAIAAANAVAAAVGTNLQARTGTSIAILQNSVEQQLAAAREPAARRLLRAQLTALSRVKPNQQQTIGVIDPAVDAQSVSNQPGLAAALALIVALLVGLKLASLAERADRRIHDPADIETLAAKPVLAALPRGAVTSPEPFLRLRDTIVHLCGQGSRTTVSVASPMRSDGRTSVALGLANAFAASGRSVVLVDADLRNPAIAVRAGVPASPGLAEVLGGSGLDGSLRTWDGPAGGITILPAGSPEPESSDRLASARMASVLHELAERFEVTILDTPPLLAVSDALPVSQQASGVVLVARIDHTPARALQRAVQILNEAGANVLGPVATRVATDGAGRIPASPRLKDAGRRFTLRAAGAGEPGARR